MNCKKSQPHHVCDVTIFLATHLCHEHQSSAWFQPIPVHSYQSLAPSHSCDRRPSQAPAYPREIAGRSCLSVSCRPVAVGHTVFLRRPSPIWKSPEPSHHHYSYSDVGPCFLDPWLFTPSRSPSLSELPSAHRIALDM